MNQEEDDDDEVEDWRFRAAGEELCGDEYECQFPSECCMPGVHHKSECHTADMIEDQERELEKDFKRDMADMVFELAISLACIVIVPPVLFFIILMIVCLFRGVSPW